MWHPIATAPFNRDLELAVLDRDGPHAMIFPCRRTLTGWIASKTRHRIDVSPTHWRAWRDVTAEDRVGVGEFLNDDALGLAPKNLGIRLVRDECSRLAALVRKLLG